MLTIQICFCGDTQGACTQVRAWPNYFFVRAFVWRLETQESTWRRAQGHGNAKQGTSFDSCQAYVQYTLFAWENGFGIQHGKSIWGEGRYQLIHEIVCQCQGKPDKENSVSCKTQCKARMRLLRTEDHGWYVCEVINTVFWRGTTKSSAGITTVFL